MEDVTKRHLGEIIDEVITLCLKMSHDINERTIGRMDALLFYLENSQIDTQLRHTINLLCANSACFLAQDKIMSSKHYKEIGTWAKHAQILNKERNKLIGELNGNQGFITTKTY